VSYLHRVVPIASTSSLAHALALSAHMYVCLLLCVYSVLCGCHTAARSFPELGQMTHTDLSAPLWLHVSINERTNRIGDLRRYRVSWGCSLMVPLRVHMLSIDYQNYQVQKIKVINKTGHPACWTRQTETLNCQPTQLLCHMIRRCQQLGVTKCHLWRKEECHALPNRFDI